MIAPAEVIKAHSYVKIYHPDVIGVVYTSDTRWHFYNSDFEMPAFGEFIDVGILEDAADSVKEFPAVFEPYD